MIKIDDFSRKILLIDEFDRSSFTGYMVGHAWLDFQQSGIKVKEKVKKEWITVNNITIMI